MKAGNYKKIIKAKSRERWKRDSKRYEKGYATSKEVAGKKLSLQLKRVIELKKNPETSYSLSYEEFDNIPDITEFYNKTRKVNTMSNEIMHDDNNGITIEKNVRGWEQVRNIGITLEKNIPIPVIRPRAEYREKYNFLNHMEIGDSFVISKNTPNFHPDYSRKYIYTLQANSKFNKKFTIRTLSGKSTNPKAIRVWRIR